MKDEIVEMLKTAKRKLEAMNVSEKNRTLRIATNWGIVEVDSDGNFSGDERGIAEAKEKILNT